MGKHLLDIGNCGPDHFSITEIVKQFGADITQAHGMDDAIRALECGTFDLITVNRIMDKDGSEGLDIIRAIKRDEKYCTIPVMLITNFENYQQQAVIAGAVQGFGKDHMHAQATADSLGTYLK